MLSAPYCGAPPLPGSIWERWNLDPVLIACLLGAAFLHMVLLRRSPRRQRLAALGWAAAAAALLSPLCALSVSLFAARIAQHMILVLVAAPLIAAALPEPGARQAPWASAAVFTMAMWLWHMPAPYAATFHSDLLYWAMHASIFGSAVFLWRDLLLPAPEQLISALCAGLGASVLMGLLGAVLTLAGHPLFAPHFATTAAWGLTPLEDQQLGGVIMWVPAMGLFLYAFLASLARVLSPLEEKPAG